MPLPSSPDFSSCRIPLIDFPLNPTHFRFIQLVKHVRLIRDPHTQPWLVQSRPTRYRGTRVVSEEGAGHTDKGAATAFASSKIVPCWCSRQRHCSFPTSLQDLPLSVAMHTLHSSRFESLETTSSPSSREQASQLSWSPSKISSRFPGHHGFRQGGCCHPKQSRAAVAAGRALPRGPDALRQWRERPTDR